MSYTSSSNGSRPKSINSNRSKSRNPNPHRFYAASCNSSGDLAAQQRDNVVEEVEPRKRRPKSNVSQSTHSTSDASQPELIAFLPKDIPANPLVPEKYRAEPGPIPDASSAPGWPLTPATFHQIAPAPPAEALPEHTSSPVATPREGSPVTPLTQTTQDVSVNEMTTTTATKLENISTSHHPATNLPVPTTKPKKLSRPTSDAFLAGEARELQLPDDDERPSSDLPLRSWGGSVPSQISDKSNTHKSIDRLVSDVEKRPDSSRARLGLRASMLVRTDAVPWEGNEDPNTPPPLSPVSASTKNSTGPVTPRTFLSKGFVGSLRSTRS